jgi:hypothetical protein
MLASGLLIGLFALAAAQDEAPPAENPYPAREVLAAFATACSGVENLAVAKASVVAAGWQAIPADDKGALRQLVDYGKAKLAESDAEAKLLDGGEYRMTVAGRELALALSGVDLGDLQSHGCRVYDFTAPAPISADELESWAVRKPGSSTDPMPGLTKHIWNPGLKPGHMEMEVSYAAPGALAATGIPLTGLVLTATAVEFRKK